MLTADPKLTVATMAPKQSLSMWGAIPCPGKYSLMIACSNGW